MKDLVLNETKVENYSAELSKHLCDKFFYEKKAITGKEIAAFCDIQQINFFVIRHLFANWINEASKLESPYFDFDHANVQNALSKFMNQLSHHIKVGRKHFEPLLFNAIFDYIESCAQPRLFYKEVLLSFPVNSVDIKDIEDIKKYIRLNTFIIDGIYSLFRKEKMQNLNTIKSKIDEIIDEKHAELFSVDEMISSLNKIYPITKSSIILSEEPAADTKKQTTQTSGKSTSSKDNSINNHHEEEEHIPTVNDKFIHKTDPKTLNDKLTTTSEKKSLAKQYIADKKVTSIKTSIGINQRFMFIKKLFEGNKLDYDNAISSVDDFREYETASDYLIDNYAQKYNWSEKEQEVNELLLIISRKF